MITIIDQSVFVNKQFHYTLKKLDRIDGMYNYELIAKDCRLLELGIIYLLNLGW